MDMPMKPMMEMQGRLEQLKREMEKVELKLGDIKKQPEPGSEEAERQTKELLRRQEEIRQEAHAIQDKMEQMKRSMMERPDGGREWDMEIFQLEHADALHIAEMLQRMFPDGVRAVADPRTNKVIVMSNKEGFDRSRRIVRELDMPARWGDRDRPEGQSQRPRYEYEQRRAPERRDGESSQQRDRDVPRESDRPRFQRTVGKVVEASESTLTLLPEGSEKPMTFQLPALMGEAGERKPDRALAEKLKTLRSGDAIVVEWGEGEGTRFIAGIGSVQKEGEKK
jgi:hypothetical protein